MKYCEHCHTFLPENKFYVREDRPGLYAWCTNCMYEQKRSPDYPPIKQRGYGLIGLFAWR
jgi:RNase P subunit RPR2